MQRVAFMTLGCKTNQYDAEYMREQFLRAGYAPVDFDEIADVYVVNTCMVTATGERKSLKYVRQAARRNPQADIVVAGCVAQHEGEKLALRACGSSWATPGGGRSCRCWSGRGGRAARSAP